mmetsp:Transcript_96159/g.161632  ORF Transcript_96159/g.161632 Transcript_96159/m.161632 type:complete len:84 (+) Transcript_96159:211-462(+)
MNLSQSTNTPLQCDNTNHLRVIGSCILGHLAFSLSGSCLGVKISVLAAASDRGMEWGIVAVNVHHDKACTIYVTQPDDCIRAG